MTLREHCTPDQLAAHAFLDDVRAGLDVHYQTIVHALRVLGEPANIFKPIREIENEH
jgi:chromosome condensin MukBEF MukE localization factor